MNLAKFLMRSPCICCVICHPVFILQSYAFMRNLKPIFAAVIFHPGLLLSPPPLLIEDYRLMTTLRHLDERQIQSPWVVLGLKRASNRNNLSYIDDQAELKL